MPKLSPSWTDQEIVTKIRSEPAWETGADLAVKYGLSEATISNIRTRKTHHGGTRERLSKTQSQVLRTELQVLISTHAQQFDVSELKIRKAICTICNSDTS